MNLGKEHKALIKKSFQGVVFLGLTLFLLQAIDWREFGMLLGRLNIGYFLFFLLLQVVAIGYSVRKWQQVAAARDIHFPFLLGSKQYILGMFLNNFFPSTIGGDMYRAHFLKRFSGEDYTKVLHVVLFERLQGLWILLLLITLSGGFFWSLTTESFLLASVFVGASGLLALSLFFFWLLEKNWLSGFLKRFSFRYPKHVAALWEDDFRQKILPVGLGTTSLFVLTGPLLSNYVLFLAFGIELPLFLFAYLVAAAILVSSLPISLGNLGLKEGAYVLLFGLVGVSAEAALAVALVSRVAQVGFSLLALPGYMSKKETC
jgi:glycosyltransferase 2 family protein